MRLERPLPVPEGFLPWTPIAELVDLFDIRASVTDEPPLSLASCTELLRTRNASAVELMRTLLARIRRYDHRLDSFIETYDEDALEMARRCDAERASGIPCGPLHGVPYAAKDIIDVAGRHTTCHSSVMRDHVASHDATVVARLRRAGAILIGKTALHEFATGGPSFDLPSRLRAIHGIGTFIPEVPRAARRSAVAAGFVPMALGTIPLAR